MDPPKKGGILKGRKAAMSNPISMNGDASSDSSMHSIFNPTFNPSIKPTSGTINDSDSSTSESIQGLRSNVGTMAKIVEGRSNLRNQASNLAPTSANLASNLAPDVTNLGSNLDTNVPPLDPNLAPNFNPNLGANPSNFTGPFSRYGSLQAKPSYEDHQGYFSDSSSTNSTVRSRLAPRLHSQLSTHGRASHLEPSIYEETPKLQSSTTIVNLSFKERNFNFDFENISLTSTMGVQAFEDIYGKPSAPIASVQRSRPSYRNDTYQSHAHQQRGGMPHISEQSTTSSEAQTPTPASHNIGHQSHVHQYEGRVRHIGEQSTTTSLAPTLAVASLNIDDRPILRTSGDSRKMGPSLDDNNSISMSLKPRSLQNSSMSSSSLMRNISPLEASASKKESTQHSLDQSIDLFSEEISTASGEKQGCSLEKFLTMGRTKGTFLLCGTCIPEGNVKSIYPSFIEDYDSTNVIDCVKSLWADTYQPTSFDAFFFHVQQAQLLRQLISQGNCPHIFFHGLSNYGKKSLIMVLLREIFGPTTWKVSQEKKEFKKKGEKKVPVQVVASKYHVELDAESLGENARTILVGLFKEITQSMDSRVIDTDADYGITFKVIVLYGIDKLSNDTQQLIRWLMDRYGDTCKLLVCSDHANNILDSIKSRCQIVGVDLPSQQEMVNVLQHIAGQEKMRVSLDFIIRIANESKQNLRHAIESLEACKPLLQGQAPREDLPIPTGWEDVVADLAKDILMEQTPKRMFAARNKLQSLLKGHVPPQLILRSLVIELLRKLNFHLKKEICYWHGLYENRLLSTRSAIDKLEEFVAKIMSIYKRYKKANILEIK